MLLSVGFLFFQFWDFGKRKQEEEESFESEVEEEGDGNESDKHTASLTHTLEDENNEKRSGKVHSSN